MAAGWSSWGGAGGVRTRRQLEVGEDGAHDRRILDGGDDAQPAATAGAGRAGGAGRAYPHRALQHGLSEAFRVRHVTRLAWLVAGLLVVACLLFAIVQSPGWKAKSGHFAISGVLDLVTRFSSRRSVAGVAGAALHGSRSRA